MCKRTNVYISTIQQSNSKMTVKVYFNISNIICRNITIPNYIKTCKGTNVYGSIIQNPKSKKMY